MSGVEDPLTSFEGVPISVGVSAGICSFTGLGEETSIEVSKALEVGLGYSKADRWTDRWIDNDR